MIVRMAALLPQKHLPLQMHVWVCVCVWGGGGGGVKVCSVIPSHIPFLYLVPFPPSLHAPLPFSHTFTSSSFPTTPLPSSLISFFLHMLSPTPLLPLYPISAPSSAAPPSSPLLSLPPLQDLTPPHLYINAEDRS